MRGSVKATFILVIMFIITMPICRAFPQSADYARSISALDHRIGELEKSLKDFSDYVSSKTEDNIIFYRETEKAIKKTDQKVDSIKQLMSYMERKQVDTEELKSRVNALETQMLELKRKRAVAERSDDDAKLLPVTYQQSPKQNILSRYEQAYSNNVTVMKNSKADDTDIYYAWLHSQDEERKETRCHTLIRTEHWEPDYLAISAAAGLLVCLLLLSSQGQQQW